MQMKPWIIVVITEIRVKDVGVGLICVHVICCSWKVIYAVSVCCIMEIYIRRFNLRLY